MVIMIACYNAKLTCSWASTTRGPLLQLPDADQPNVAIGHDARRAIMAGALVNLRRFGASWRRLVEIPSLKSASTVMYLPAIVPSEILGASPFAATYPSDLGRFPPFYEQVMREEKTRASNLCLGGHHCIIRTCSYFIGLSLHCFPYLGLVSSNNI
jgi:hypothetical protein